MINPRLGILSLLNPKGRKGKKKMAHRKRGKAYMAWVRSHRKGRKRSPRRYRRNPFPVGGLVVNPRKGRGRRRQRIVLENRRRRRYRRNPVIFGKSFTVPSLQPVLFAGAGYVGTGWLENLLTVGSTNSDGTTTAPIIPTSITGSTVGKYAVKIGCVIATGYLAKLALGGERAKWVAIGGGVNVLVAAAKEFGPSIPGLSAYTPLRGYQPGLAARRPQLFGQRSAPVNYDFGAQLADRGSR